jgi:hypothetical protein
VSAPRISYVPRRDATQENELRALASIYGFILDCTAKEEGGSATAPDNAMKGSNDDRAANIIPGQP